MSTPLLTLTNSAILVSAPTCENDNFDGLASSMVAVPTFHWLLAASPLSFQPVRSLPLKGVMALASWPAAKRTPRERHNARAVEGMNFMVLSDGEFAEFRRAACKRRGSRRESYNGRVAGRFVPCHKIGASDHQRLAGRLHGPG